MGEFPDSSTPATATATALTNSRPAPAREDCWSEDATFTLIEAWGQRYVEFNRGNLRQKQWQEVADAVNARHGHNKKARRTDIQCKNRIDTLKKKYKAEKTSVVESNGNYKSSWPFFDPLDDLIGTTVTLKKLSPSPRISPTPPPMAVPLLPHRAGVGAGGILPQKRPLVPAALPFQREGGSSDFRRNYSAMAAAAAAESDEEDEEEEEREREEEEREEEEEEVSGGGAEGIRKLARVIERFGEVYAKVEAEKQRQLIELEKQRMQFAKELECQRMQMLVEMQVQLEKIKRAKRSDSNDMYS